MPRTHEPVFDYAVGTPWVVTDAIEAAIESARGEDRSIREAVATATTRQFRTDPAFRERFRACYERAGVDLASVTVSGRRPRDDLLGWQARFDAADWLRKAVSPDAARGIAADGDVGVVLNTQNAGAAIDGDAAELETLYNAGVRLFQLTYNLGNLVGAGCYARRDCGLSQHGVAVVERLNDLGGVVDLSHCGRETTLDAIGVSEAPVAFTHTSCRAVADHPRGKSDEELRALAEADGYMGVVGVPWFLAPDEDDPDLSAFFEHLEHAASVLGTERVGIGTDFGNVDADAPAAYLDEARERAVEAGFPEGYGEGYGGGFGAMRRYTDWPALRDGLEERYADGEVRDILGGNFLDFWERVV